MAEKIIQDVINLTAITNGDPSNGDIWRDESDGLMKIHDNGTTSNLVGAGGPVTAYRTTDLARTSTSVAADTDMAVAVEANSVYRVDVYLEASYAGASYLKFDFTGPSGASLVAIGTSDAGNQVYAEIGAAVSFTSSDFTVALSGRLTTTGAGTLGLSWGITTGSSAVTLAKGSHIILTKLN